MIEEARNRVIDIFCNLEKEYLDHLTYGGKGDAETEADIHALEEVIAALDWYREQDLIRREDVTKIFAEHIELTTDMDEGQAMFVAEHQYRRIPKVEPPFTRDANVSRNGDRLSDTT